MSSASEFVDLHSILRSKHVSEEDKKRAIACYRRVQVSYPLNTSVNIHSGDRHDIHILEIHADKSVSYVKTDDGNKVFVIRFDTSCLPQQLFGRAAPVTPKDKRLSKQQTHTLRELYPNRPVSHVATYDVLHCTACRTEKCDSRKMKKCVSCRAAFYCDRRCQKEDWPLHKLTCG